MNKLDISDWQKFRISELFITEPSKNKLQVPTGASIARKDLVDGDIPRITVTNFNNGIVGYYKNIDSDNYRVFENFISVSFLGTIFYHPYKASLDMKVHCLKLKNKDLNKDMVIPPKRAASKSRINTSPAFSAGRVSLLKPSYAFALE